MTEPEESKSAYEGQPQTREAKPGCLPQSFRRYHAFFLLQEKWVLFIVQSLMNGPKGFNEISREAQCVNTTTLSARLDLLEEKGIVTRAVHSSIPPRTSYELTAAGKALETVIEAIVAWSEEFLPEEAFVVPPRQAKSKPGTIGDPGLS